MVVRIKDYVQYNIVHRECIMSKLQLFQPIYPSANFQNVQFPKRQLPNSVLAAALGPQPVLAVVLSSPSHCNLRRLRGPNLTFRKLPPGKLHILEVAAWENIFGKVHNTYYLSLFIWPFVLGINGGLSYGWAW